jgi:hypothetical protein
MVPVGESAIQCDRAGVCLGLLCKVRATDSIAMILSTHSNAITFRNLTPHPRLRPPSIPLFKSRSPSPDVATIQDIVFTHRCAVILLDLREIWPSFPTLWPSRIDGYPPCSSSTPTRQRPRLGGSTCMDERCWTAQEESQEWLQDGSLSCPAGRCGWLLYC